MQKKNMKALKRNCYLYFILISESEGPGCADYPSQPAVSPAVGCYGCQDWFVGSQQNCIASMESNFCVLKQ